MNLLTTKNLSMTGRLRLILCLALLAGGTLLARPQSAAASTTITVNTTDDGLDQVTGDGKCDATAPGEQCTLRAAIMEANSLIGIETIVVPAGVYTLTEVGMVNQVGGQNDLDITTPLTVQGAGRSKTIIDGDDVDRVFFVATGSSVEIKDLTIRNGKANYSGGGVFHYGGELKLTNVAISGNEATDGGGVASSKGTLTITNSLIQGNSAKGQFGPMGAGGGVWIGMEATASIYASAIRNNTSGSGGGIFHARPLLLENSTLSGNSSTGAGGGISSYGQLAVANTTISGNTAAGAGGGIWLSDGAQGATLVQLTIAANQAANGGGIATKDDLLKPTMESSIIAANTATIAGPDCKATVNTKGYNLWGNVDGCARILVGYNDLVNVNPQLGPLRNNGGPTMTHALGQGSPALDGGYPAAAGSFSCTGKDQRGASRGVDGNGDGKQRCDIGAFEYNGPTITKLSRVSRPAGSDGFTLTITGSNFTPKSVVRWNGAKHASQFVNKTTIRVQVTEADLKSPKKIMIQVQMGGVTVNSGLSNSVRFIITK